MEHRKQPESAGERLRAIRDDRGLSQLALAQASGVSLAHINRIERDRRGLTIRSARRLARALHVPVTDLIDLSEGAEDGSGDPAPLTAPRGAPSRQTDDDRTTRATRRAALLAPGG